MPTMSWLLAVTAMGLAALRFSGRSSISWAVVALSAAAAFMPVILDYGAFLILVDVCRRLLDWKGW